MYYKTLLNGKKHKEKLYYVMKYLGELIRSKDENGNIVLPKEITLKILIEHFAEIVTEGAHEITLKPNETKDWTATIRMPTNKYDGIILGGLHFQENKDEDAKKKSEEKDVQIKNKYAYVIGVKLTETPTVVKKI